MKTPNQITGTLGESLAIEFLENKGYKIIERNWKYSMAEIDLIAFCGDILVFIEVKTRSYDSLGKPEEFISRRKMDLISEAANIYMQQINHDWEIRFDVISIIRRSNGSMSMEHMEDAWFYTQ